MKKSCMWQNENSPKKQCKVLHRGSSLSSGTGELRNHQALHLHLMHMYINFAYLLRMLQLPTSDCLASAILRSYF